MIDFIFDYFLFDDFDRKLKTIKELKINKLIILNSKTNSNKFINYLNELKNNRIKYLFLNKEFYFDFSEINTKNYSLNKIISILRKKHLVINLELLDTNRDSLNSSFINIFKKNNTFFAFNISNLFLNESNNYVKLNLNSKNIVVFNKNIQICIKNKINFVYGGFNNFFDLNQFESFLKLNFYSNKDNKVNKIIKSCNKKFWNTFS